MFYQRVILKNIYIYYYYFNILILLILINSLKLKTSYYWICFIFSLLQMLSDGLEWCGLLVDYCDVFISCLDSHSDGTHSLQRIIMVFLKCLTIFVLIAFYIYIHVFVFYPNGLVLHSMHICYRFMHSLGIEPMTFDNAASMLYCSIYKTFI